MSKLKPVKVNQTVTPNGELVGKRIAGLTIRRSLTHEDSRGEIVEVYNPAWGVHPDPMVYSYFVTVRPGAIRGWVVHRAQDDRINVCLGVQRWVFYDDRKNSPTFKLLNQFTFSERNRVLFVIPPGVYHAVQNVGKTDALFINLPNRAYDHEDPDKYRLPLKNKLIPFDFTDQSVW